VIEMWLNIPSAKGGLMDKRILIAGFLGGLAMFIAVVGVIAAIATNISYCNWYGFPGAYTASYMTITAVGYIIAGAVVAAVLARRALVAIPATA
jgi:hypothetical protein